MTPWIYTIVGMSIQRHLPLQRATSRLTTPAADPGRVPGVVWVHSQTFMHASTRGLGTRRGGRAQPPKLNYRSENPHVTLVWGWGVPSTSHYNTLDHIKKLYLQSEFPQHLHKVLVLSLPPALPCPAPLPHGPTHCHWTKNLHIQFTDSHTPSLEVRKARSVQVGSVGE